MKAIVLHGSPRKHGDSDTLADSFLSGMQAQGECQVTHFYTNEMKIHPCQGCLKCNDCLDGYCATKDDMQQIYSAFIDSEVVVFATPMYWGYMTAQLKAVMDRMEAITGYFEGKTFVVLITYHHHCASTVAFFERITPFFGVKLHVITCRTMDEKTEANIPASAIPEKLIEADELGRKVRQMF